jgi:tetratricopeptide (TPR) repeat protein
MREGFAVFFEKTGYDPATNSWIYQENLAWLDTLKTLAENEGAGLLPLKTILSMNVDQARERIEVFYPQAWGIVSFLVNSPNREHNRLLWDAISALRPEASLEENIERIYNRAVKWYEEEQLAGDFLYYLEERKSFRSLVQEGIDLYSGNELDRSESAFLSAMEVEEENFIPYYYMGLINYSRKNYSVADHYYKTALGLGAQPSLIHYAMGVNSFADNRFEDAEASLKSAGELDPAYKEKAEELLKRIRK